MIKRNFKSKIFFFWEKINFFSRLFNSISVFYECLTDWITIIGGNSGFYNYSSSFIDVILSNITPHKSNLLAIEKNSNQSGKKGTSNDKKELLFNNKSILNNYQLEIRSQIIVSALKCKIFLSFKIIF